VVVISAPCRGSVFDLTLCGWKSSISLNFDKLSKGT
jgi:hypothetical protein